MEAFLNLTTAAVEDMESSEHTHTHSHIYLHRMTTDERVQQPDLTLTGLDNRSCSGSGSGCFGLGLIIFEMIHVMCCK